MTELEQSLNYFMKLLQDDIQKEMGEGVPFMVRLDIRLAVQPDNVPKMKEYEPKLTALLNSVQSSHVVKITESQIRETSQ